MPAASSRRAAISRRCARNSARPRSSASPRPGPQFERTGITVLGLRRSAGDAGGRARRPAARPATRRWSTTATASRCSCSTRASAADAATRAAVVAPDPAQLKDALRGWEKGPPGFAADRAAAQDRDCRPTRCSPTCSPRSAIARSSATIRCRASERAFAEQVKRARARLPAVAEGAFRLLAAIAAEYQALSQRIGALPPSLAAPRRRGRGAARRARLLRDFFARRPGRSSATCRAT